MESISDLLKEEDSEVVLRVPGMTSGHSESNAAQHSTAADLQQPSMIGEPEETNKEKEAKDEHNTLNNSALVQKADMKEDDLQFTNDQELVINEANDREDESVKPIINPVKAVLEEEQSQGTHQQVISEVLEEGKAKACIHSPFDQEDLVMLEVRKAQTEEGTVSDLTTTSTTISQSECCHEKVHVPHLSESTKDILSIFGVTAKAAAEVLMQFVTDKRSVKEKSDLAWSTQILQALEEVTDICVAIQEITSAVEQIAVYVTTETHILYAFYGFLTIFSAFCMDGINAMLVNSLMMVHKMIAEWTYSSKTFCKTIVKEGLMVQHIDELQMLQKAWKSIEIASNFAEINLNILYNCSRVANIKAYFTHPKYDCGRILMPFTQSSVISVRTHAIFVLTHLATLLASQPADLIHPCPEIMNNLLRIFEFASTTDDRTVCVATLTRVMTVTEIAHILENLQTNEENYKLMIERDLIPTLVSLLAVGGDEELKSASLLLWRLLHHSSFREKASSSDLPIAETVQMLCDTSDKDLKQLFLCTCLALEGINEKDTSVCLDYAEGCYKYGYYLECVELCKSLKKRKSTEDENNRVSFLLAKSNFHLYRRERLELRHTKLFKEQYTREYNDKHKRCYDKAKAVIGALGIAMDNGLLDNKEEELRMLDVAMIDYFQETKKLDRCLLCQRKTRLMRSHFFPKCLLKDFSSGLESGNDQRILLPSFYYRGIPKSPGEITYFMFCNDCEQFLSKHGENQFRSQFFSHIYDPNNPLQRITEQCIEYDAWLYEFCLGIILRGLAVYHQDGFFNGDKIHELYQKCREFLLHPNSLSQEKSPTIALIMSPLEKNLHDGGIPNEIVAHAFVQYWHLDTGLDGARQFGPPILHSFVVHFGEINIVAVVNKKDIQNIPDGCLITRNKGKYTVPDEKSRWHTTPRGIIKGMQRIVEVIDEVQLQLGSKYLEEHVKKEQAQKLNMVSDQLKETFLIAPLSRTASVDFTPSLEEVPSNPLLANLLPEQFVVIPPFINLPKGHRILIHACLGASEEAGDIVFIAIGNSGPYTPDRPYLIHYQYKPRAKISMGYFINPIDYSVQEFLPDKFPKQLLKSAAEDKIIKQIQSEWPQLLPKLMMAKGFINLQSLLKHAQTNSDINYDIKCKKPQRCLYCSGLCEICLKPASFGLSREEEDGTILRFCSEQCQTTHKIRFSPVESEKLTTEVWIPPSCPPPHFQASPVSSNHRVLLSISAEGKSARGKYVVSNMVVCCTGDIDGEDGLPADKLYAAFTANEMDHPMFIDFFITDDGKPEKPLPYCLCPTSVAVTEGLCKSNEIKRLISNALLSKGVPNLSCLRYIKEKECNNFPPRGEGVDQPCEPEKTHVLPSHQLHIHTLPEQFAIHPVGNPSSIKLPEGHQILLHETVNNSKTSIDTFFIAIGNCSPYDKPYLIHHHHDPHAVINVGYFISPNGCSVQEFLSDSESPKQGLKDATDSAFVREMRSQYPQLLPQVIESKGFVNLASLMKHAQTQRDVNYDTKCSKPHRCWYCSDRCEMCLKPASSSGLSSRGDDGTVLYFCSESCETVHKIRSSPVESGKFTVEGWMPPSAPPPHFRAFPVGSNDKVLLCINVEGGSARGNCTQINMAVCAGDVSDERPADKLYVVYVTNELDHQMFIEFFVNNEGEPEMPLPYCLCPSSIAQTEVFRKSNQVQKLISAVLLSKGIPNLSCIKLSL